MRWHYADDSRRNNNSFPLHLSPSLPRNTEHTHTLFGEFWNFVYTINSIWTSENYRRGFIKTFHLAKQHTGPSPVDDTASVQQSTTINQRRRKWCTGATTHDPRRHTNRFSLETRIHLQHTYAHTQLIWMFNDLAFAAISVDTIDGKQITESLKLIRMTLRDDQNRLIKINTCSDVESEVGNCKKNMFFLFFTRVYVYALRAPKVWKQHIQFDRCARSSYISMSQTTPTAATAATEWEEWYKRSDTLNMCGDGDEKYCRRRLVVCLAIIILLFGR